MSVGDIWWSQRWLDPILESRDLRVKVRKGRVVARRGRVHDLTVRGGLATAVVEEDSGARLSVRLRMAVIDDDVWERVAERVAGEAAHAATLLGGRISEGLVHLFEEAGAELFPFDTHDFTYFCTCHDDGAVCVHGVAMHFALGEAMIGDPFIFLEFRGRSRDALLGALRESRPAALAAGPEADDDEADSEPVDELASTYWEAGPMPHLAFRPARGDDEDEEALPVVRALGPGPGETPPEQIADVLAPLVRLARRRTAELLDRALEEPRAAASGASGASAASADEATLDEVLVAAAQQRGSLTAQAVADALAIPPTKARQYLDWLVEEGRLRRVVEDGAPARFVPA